MTTAVASLSNPLPRIAAWRLSAASPRLARLTLAILLAILPLAVAMALDARQIEGVSIWVKPLKFHLALVLYLATLVVMARWLPARMTGGRVYRVYETYVVLAIVAELLWIGGAAALGTTSHFNEATPVMAVLYPLMGVFAVSLTSLSLVFGVAILRNPATGLSDALRHGIGWGLILTFGLTVLVAGYMAQTGSHFVGTPADPADRLWLLGWSREVGDLRAPHFLATHGLHALPVVALLAQGLMRPARAVVTVWMAGLGWTALVAATFAQALAGMPLV